MTPPASQITLKARGGQTETPIACSVAIGRAIYRPRPTRESEAPAPPLVRANAAWSHVGLRPDHLPDGRVAMGIPTDDRSHGRGRFGSSWHAGNRQGRAGRLSALRLRFDIAAAASHAGTIAGIAREDRTILCGDADVDPTAEPCKPSGFLKVEVRFCFCWGSACCARGGALGRAIWRGLILMRPESTRPQ